jgi:Arc/MetJ-type ribon-helix-helix transcriptional regulator
MTNGMKADRAEKIAVSVPAGLLKEVRRLVKAGRASSVSAYVAQALENETKQERLEDLLEEWLEASGGPATAAEQSAARQTIDAAVRRARR